MTKRRNRIWVRTQSNKKHTWIVLAAITPSPLFVHLQNLSKPSFLFFSPLSRPFFFFFGLWWSFLLKVIMPLSLILSYSPWRSTKKFTLPKLPLIHCCPSFWSVEKIVPLQSMNHPFYLDEENTFLFLLLWTLSVKERTLTSLLFFL